MILSDTLYRLLLGALELWVEIYLYTDFSLPSESLKEFLWRWIRHVFIVVEFIVPFESTSRSYYVVEGVRFASKSQRELVFWEVSNEQLLLRDQLS